MDKVKRWFENLSGGTKYMILLCVIFTITNIGLTVAITVKSNETVNVINSGQFSSDANSLYQMFGLDGLFDALKQTADIMIVLAFNAMGYILSYWIGKGFGFFKSLIEMVTDIQKDGLGYLIILLYDVLSLFFDMTTIASFVVA